MFVQLSQFGTALILGLFAGSMLTEALVLVPFWRAMESEAFFRLYRSLKPWLYRYFSPITILATVIPTVTAVISVVNRSDCAGLSVAVSVLSLGVLGTYFCYFKRANAGFASEDPDIDGLPAELKRWATWHWSRTVIVIVALGMSLYVLL